jgi:Arc/MetJ-type ribon-helix-helix transcriptional regulator
MITEWWNSNTIVNEEEYLRVYNTLKTTYGLSDEQINSGRYSSTTDTTRQTIQHLLYKLNKDKPTRLNIYKELLKDCVPVSPYARVRTQADIESIRYKEQERERQRKKIRYTEIDYYPQYDPVYGNWGQGN